MENEISQLCTELDAIRSEQEQLRRRQTKLNQRWLESLYSDKVLELDFKSCEMIAEDLYTVINDRYPSRCVNIDVSEDGENGAWMMWKP